MNTKDIERVSRFIRGVEAYLAERARAQKEVQDMFYISIEEFNDVKTLMHEVERLENLLFEMGAMGKAPCFCCGYNGPGYYQPKKHPCAKKHHSPLNKRGKSDG